MFDEQDGGMLDYYDLTTQRGRRGTEKTGAVRFSFSYFNTEEEVDTAAGAVKELAAE